MKAITLLLLLLFSSLLYGQEISNSGSRFTDFETSYVFSDGWEAKVTVGEVTYQNKVGIYQTMVLATIVQQWKEYQAECYADSTDVHIPDRAFTIEKEADDYYDLLVSYNTSFVFGSRYDKYSKTYLVYRVMWTHREPTPIGFMEYLTEKLEEK